MTIAKQIMTPYPFTVTPDISVRELAAELAHKNYSGAPVVNDDGSLIGIVTESDIIFQKKNIHLPTFFTLFDSVISFGGESDLDEHIKKIGGQTVGEIMSEEVVTVDGETTLEEMATVMTEKHIHFLPVMIEGKLSGVVDRSDILRSMVKENTQEG